MADANLLELDRVETFYGLSQVLFGVSLSIGRSEVVTLMGRNGMGKTTTVRSVLGLTRARAGTIRFEGLEICALPAYRVAKLGIGLVPEGRQIFPNLTVRENLVATAANRAGAGNPWTLDRVFRLFPLLAEPEGLAPLMRAEIWRCLAGLKAAGLSILLIDKNVEALTRIADRHYIIEKGQVVWTGTSPQLAAASDIRHRYLSI